MHKLCEFMWRIFRFFVFQFGELWKYSFCNESNQIKFYFKIFVTHFDSVPQLVHVIDEQTTFPHILFFFFCTNPNCGFHSSIHSEKKKSRNRKCISLIEKYPEEVLKSILIHKSTMNGLGKTCANWLAIVSMVHSSDTLKHFTWYVNRHPKWFLFWVYVCGNSARSTTRRQAKCHGCISTR